MSWKLAVAHVAVRGCSIGAGKVYINLGEADKIAGTGLGIIGLLKRYLISTSDYFVVSVGNSIVLDVLLNCFA